MNELKEVSSSDWPQISSILAEFQIEAGKTSCDRDRLYQIAAQAAELELKYAPALSAQVSLDLPKENRCVVTSVGMRTQPILLTLAILRPRLIVFAHTRETVPGVTELRTSVAWGQLFAEQEPQTARIQVDPGDSTGSYRQLSDIVRQERGGNWIVDITGGRKITGATLSAFAFWRRIPVVYLNSKEVQGIPEPFSERLIRLDNPYSTFGDPLLKTAEASYNQHHYPTTIEALQQLRETVGIIELDHMAATALQLVMCYLQWDRFVHSSEDKTVAEAFYEDFREAIGRFKRFGYEFFGGDSLEVNCQFIQQLEQAYEPAKPALVDEYRLADVFCNATRRADQGLFDDAIARLYRCIEMAATIVLKKLVPSFDPDKADWEGLRAKFQGMDLDKAYREKSKKAGHRTEGLPNQQQIGVSQQMALLGTIADAIHGRSNHPSEQLLGVTENAETMYRIYEGALCKKNLLTLRNRSILAHGTKALDERTYDTFRSVTIKICQHAVSPQDWQQLVRAATFPTMRLTTE